MILATWLTQAADEEQTSVLLIILKVFVDLEVISWIILCYCYLTL